MEGGCTGTKSSESGRNWNPLDMNAAVSPYLPLRPSASSSLPPSLPIPVSPEAQAPVICAFLGVSATFSLCPNRCPLMAHWCPHCHLQLTCEQLHLPACCTARMPCAPSALDPELIMLGVSVQILGMQHPVVHKQTEG